jgi:hypothetical protein
MKMQRWRRTFLPCFLESDCKTIVTVEEDVTGQLATMVAESGDTLAEDDHPSLDCGSGDILSSSDTARGGDGLQVWVR